MHPNFKWLPSPDHNLKRASRLLSRRLPHQQGRRPRRLVLRPPGDGDIDRILCAHSSGHLECIASLLHCFSTQARSCALLYCCRLDDNLFNCSVVVHKEDSGQFTDTCAFLLTTTASSAACDDAAQSAYVQSNVLTSDGKPLTVLNHFDDATGACCLTSLQGQKCNVVTPLLSNGNCSASVVPKVKAACSNVFQNIAPAPAPTTPRPTSPTCVATTPYYTIPSFDSC